MKWLLFLFPLLLHAQVNLRDPAFIARTIIATTVATSIPPVLDFSMWLDFSDTTSLYTNVAGTSNALPNDRVMRVRDKSTNGTNYVVAEAIGTGGTLRLTNMYSGTVTSGVAGGFFITSNLTTLGSSNNGALTVFAVVKPWLQSAGTDASGPLWMLGAQSSSVGQTYRRNAGANQMELTDGSVGTPALRPELFTNRVAYAWCAQVDTVGDTYMVWTGYSKTNVAFTGSLTMDPGVRKMCLGQLWAFGSWQYYCDWGEFIVYPRQLSGLEVTNVMDYLIPKFGARSGP